MVDMVFLILKVSPNGFMWDKHFFHKEINMVSQTNLLFSYIPYKNGIF